MENFCKKSPTHLDRIIPEQRTQLLLFFSSLPQPAAQTVSTPEERERTNAFRPGFDVSPSQTNLRGRPFFTLGNWGTTESQTYGGDSNPQSLFLSPALVTLVTAAKRLVLARDVFLPLQCLAPTAKEGKSLREGGIRTPTTTLAV